MKKMLYFTMLSWLANKKLYCTTKFWKKQLLRKPTKAKLETKLLSRVWSSIENLPNAQQNQARNLIQKIENYPNLTINPRFKMVYKDVPQHGTKIIQLLLNNVSTDHCLILSDQDLFENISARSIYK